ncbi:MAG: biotin--[acetyl-CoA-carboxylase] ligase [Sarcina sp.]
MNINLLKDKILFNNLKDSIVFFEEIDSTNNYCKENYESLNDNTVIIAKRQSNGRGKSNRPWHSPTGGLYFSILLKEKDLSLEYSSLLPLLTSVAIFNSLKELNIDASIKWPNDVLLDHKKLSGILVESKLNSKGFKYIIVGVGINVNSLNDSENPNLDVFTSLKEKYNLDFSLELLLASILNNFQILYSKLSTEGFEDILAIYKENCPLIGKTLRLFNNNEERMVKVLDISSDGALEVLYNDKVELIHSGEFSIDKNYI